MRQKVFAIACRTTIKLIAETTKMQFIIYNGSASESIPSLGNYIQISPPFEFLLQDVLICNR